MKANPGLILLLLPILVVADHHAPGGGKGASAGTLSQQEIMSLRAGKGMGMARIADMNSYPGPRHVLEMADQLELSDEQMQQTQALFLAIKQNAIALGEQIIAAEAAVDAAFSQGSVDADAVRASVLEIGRLRAELRYAHIETHLKQRALMTEAQVAAYDKARAESRGQHGKGKGKQHGQGTGKKHGQGEGKQHGKGEQKRAQHGKH